MTTQKQIDIDMGLIGEKNVESLVNNYLGIKAEPTAYWCAVDMEDEHNCIEIKTRRNTIHKYPDLFFNHSKTKYAEKKNKSLSIVYNLTNGVYLFDYTKHKDKTYTRNKEFCYRGESKIVKMVFCPTKYFEYIGEI